MKLFSKEALLLGGLYGAIEAPFSLLGLDLITDLFFVIFIVSLLMLCFNKVPKFIPYTFNKYPKTSYYLCAIGWIPYALAIAFLFVAGGGIFIEYSQKFWVLFISTLAVVGLVGALVSLSAAYILENGK